ERALDRSSALLISSRSAEHRIAASWKRRQQQERRASLRSLLSQSTNVFSNVKSRDAGRRVSMRILIVHNYYQRPGGEDRVFESEAALLEAHGHVVLRYSTHNDSVGESGRIRLSGLAIWSGSAYREIRALCRNERPDIAHFHNTLPLISPSAYYA